MVDADLEVRYFIDGVFEDYAILFTDMSQDGCCEEFGKNCFLGMLQALQGHFGRWGGVRLL